MYGILLAEFHKMLKWKLENKHQMLSRIYLDSFLKIRSVKENIFIYIYIYTTYVYVYISSYIFRQISQTVSR
jgi:hypothetical protein